MYFFLFFFFFFFSSRRRHTRWNCDWSSDVCSSDLGELQRVRGRVFLGGSARYASPDLLEPSLVLVAGNDAENAGRHARAAVPARLALHEDELDIVLDDCFGFVRLAQEPPAIAGGLVDGIGDLVPDDRREVVESQSPAVLLDRRMQGHDQVLAFVLPARKAHISDNTYDATARNQGVKAGFPDPVQLVDEFVVVLDVPHLPFADVVVLQCPVGRRRDNQVNALGRKKVDRAGVAVVEIVMRWKLLKLGLYLRNQLLVPGNPGKLGLVVVDLGEALGKMLSRIEEHFNCISPFVHHFIIPDCRKFISSVARNDFRFNAFPRQQSPPLTKSLLLYKY